MRNAIPLAAGLAALAVSASAHAKPDVKRTGGQWGVTLGAAACIPGKAKCARPEGPDAVAPGRTRPSFGMGAELGYRWKWVFLGAGWNLGLLRPDYEVLDAPDYKVGYQNTVFGVVRPTLPLWRFDLGLSLAPGFSRQTFKRDDDTKEFTQGFAFMLGPTVDVFVSRRVFLGAKLDFIFNAHRKACVDDGDSRVCHDIDGDNVAGVHQMLFGFHIGSTFL